MPRDTVIFISVTGAVPSAVGAARVTCRTLADGDVEVAPGAGAQTLEGGDVVAWRQFRWHHGQAHYSGLYWSATTGGHVAYESRLELARLLLADFDPGIHWIVSQPFLVEADVDGATRRHVPDFALVDSDGALTIVNVKPASRLGDPKVVATLVWAGQAFASRGWAHEVWSGSPEALLANVRFLAGYRRRDRFESTLIDAVLAALADGGSVDEAEARCAGIGPPEIVRPALLHLLWSGALRVDLTEVLSGRTLLEAVP